LWDLEIPIFGIYSGFWEVFPGMMQGRRGIRLTWKPLYSARNCGETDADDADQVTDGKMEPRQENEKVR